ncbi:hypothetical protein BVI1335_1450003 [Burkholderia vietnamiensis]|nr:hypothetical protein BVI1335_1450003 [Burkholderia vietnamiensis]
MRHPATRVLHFVSPPLHLCHFGSAQRGARRAMRRHARRDARQRRRRNCAIGENQRRATASSR